MNLIATQDFSNATLGNVSAGQNLRNISEPYSHFLIDTGLAEPASQTAALLSRRQFYPQHPADEFVCIASGPSLTKKDCAAVHKWRQSADNRSVIVINTSYQLAPWADHLYACDLDWWAMYHKDLDGLFQGNRWAQDPAASKYGATALQGEHEPGLGRDQIHYGGNSGYQCVNLAYLWKAKKIILLGYDMQRTGGKSHWHGDHKGNLNKTSEYDKWARNFVQLANDLEAEGVEVLNATRETALTCFPQVPLNIALGDK